MKAVSENSVAFLPECICDDLSEYQFLRLRDKLVLLDWSALCYKVLWGMFAATARPWTEQSPGREFMVRCSKEAYVVQWMWPDSQVVLLADSKPYWRSAVHPEYKANRSSHWPSESYDKSTWYRHCDKVRDWAELAMGWSVMAVPSMEADDLAFAVATASTTERVVMVGADSDWGQIVLSQPECSWYKLNSHAPNEWRPKLDPETEAQGLAVKIISGDKSDNIPGMQKTDKQCWGKDGAVALVKDLGVADALSRFRQSQAEKFAFNRSLIVMKLIPDELLEQARQRWASLEPPIWDDAKVFAAFSRDSVDELIRERFALPDTKVPF